VGNRPRVSKLVRFALSATREGSLTDVCPCLYLPEVALALAAWVLVSSRPVIAVFDRALPAAEPPRFAATAAGRIAVSAVALLAAEPPHFVVTAAGRIAVSAVALLAAEPPHFVVTAAGRIAVSAVALTAAEPPRFVVLPAGRVELHPPSPGVLYVLPALGAQPVPGSSPDQVDSFFAAARPGALARLHLPAELLRRSAHLST
jgi:hypothetical protein